MNYDNKRNIQIDSLKIISVIIIVFHHAGFLSNVLVRGYMVVDLFFIISGFFLFGSLQHGSNASVKDFFKKRFKRYFPGYFLSWLLYFFVLLLWGRKWINYETWYAPILEIFMLQELGIPGSSRIHYPDWYMSVLLTAGTVIFIIYKKLNRKIFSVLAVLIPIIVYTYAVIFVGGMEKWERVFVLFYAPWWRGFADMLLGACIYKLKEKSEEVQINDTGKKMCYFITFLKGIIFALFLVSLSVYGYNDFVTLLFICLLIVLVVLFPRKVNEKSKADKIVSFVSSYEYELYLNHAIVIVGVRKIATIFNLNRYEWIMASLTLSVLFFYSIIFKNTAEKSLKKAMGKL